MLRNDRVYPHARRRTLASVRWREQTRKNTRRFTTPLQEIPFSCHVDHPMKIHVFSTFTDSAPAHEKGFFWNMRPEFSFYNNHLRGIICQISRMATTAPSTTPGHSQANNAVDLSTCEHALEANEVYRGNNMRQPRSVGVQFNRYVRAE